MMEPVVSIQNVSFSFSGTPVLENVTLDIRSGSFLGIVGPNGGGKTTLLKLILGLYKPERGIIQVLGRTPLEARRSIGYVPQHAAFRRDFPLSVLDTVVQGRLGTSKNIVGYGTRDYARALSALERLQLTHVARRKIGALSGGELQRVLLARALTADPSILLLDEPTANVDIQVEEDLFDVLRALNSEMTIIVVSHDIGFISQYVDTVACLNTRLVCHATSGVTGEVIEELYGRPMRMIHHHTRHDGH